MHIAVDGQGPPLVLIHGWAMHGGVFRPLLKALTPHFECWVVDLPGHGASPERDGLDLHDTAERLLARLPPTLWLGWSLGGLVALRAALDAPDRVQGLVAIAASPRFVVAQDWAHGVAHAVFESFADELGQDYARTIERFLALEVMGDEHAREEIRWLRQRLAERPPGDPAILRDGLAILADTDLRTELPALACPSLWIAGRHDRLVPWRALEYAAQASAGQFLCLAKAGHAPFLSHPEAVAAAIRESFDGKVT